MNSLGRAGQDQVRLWLDWPFYSKSMYTNTALRDLPLLGYASSILMLMKILDLSLPLLLLLLLLLEAQSLSLHFTPSWYRSAPFSTLHVQDEVLRI